MNKDSTITNTLVTPHINWNQYGLSVIYYYNGPFLLHFRGLEVSPKDESFIQEKFLPYINTLDVRHSMKIGDTTIQSDTEITHMDFDLNNDHVSVVVGVRHTNFMDHEWVECIDLEPDASMYSLLYQWIKSWENRATEHLLAQI